MPVWFGLFLLEKLIPKPKVLVKLFQKLAGVKGAEPLAAGGKRVSAIALDVRTICVSTLRQSHIKNPHSSETAAIGVPSAGGSRPKTCGFLN